MKRSIFNGIKHCLILLQEELSENMSPNIVYFHANLASNIKTKNIEEAWSTVIIETQYTLNFSLTPVSLKEYLV